MIGSSGESRDLKHLVNSTILNRSDVRSGLSNIRHSISNDS